MVVDTSALIAILKQESDAGAMVAALEGATRRIMSAATWVEAGMVALGQRGESGARLLDELVQESAIEVVPFTADHARLARQAFARYGKGRHPAGLNFGDCFSYALAKATSEPLLFEGNDFSRTDIATAF